MSCHKRTIISESEKEIMFVGRRTWMNGCGNSDRTQEYVYRKQRPMKEKYVDGSVV